MSSEHMLTDLLVIRKSWIPLPDLDDLGFRIHKLVNYSYRCCGIITPQSVGKPRLMHTGSLTGKKTAYALKTPHVIFLPVGFLSFFFWQVHLGLPGSQSQWTFFWPRDLDLWPMTLTYKLDLDILPSDLCAKIQVHMSVLLAGGVRQTHTQTDRRTMSKLLHPTRQRRGV